MASIDLQPAVAESLAAHGIVFEPMACDPDLADTAAFCAAYGIPVEDSANTILVPQPTPPPPFGSRFRTARYTRLGGHVLRDPAGLPVYGAPVAAPAQLPSIPARHSRLMIPSKRGPGPRLPRGVRCLSVCSIP